MRTVFSAVALTVGAALVLAACGDDGGTSNDTSTSDDAPVTLEGAVNDEGIEDIGGDATALFSAVDNAFDPTFVKTAAGATITVTVENVGENVHTFTIDDQDVDLEVQPGDSGEVSVDVPDGEALRFYCRFHQSQGMQGAFYTAEGQTVVGVSDSSSGGGPGYGY